MFSHKSYLKLGDASGTDFMSLIKSGYELANCEFSFQQGIDDTGKATTEVFGGTLTITLPMLPPNVIIDWALDSRKYKDGVIVVLDDANVPMEKIVFENATCTGMNVDYIQKGDSYTFTKITIQAERLIVGTGAVDFDNFWTK